MSSILRASVKRHNIGTAEEWWEMRLIDLAIVADGADEASVLEEIEHQLSCHYAMAHKLGRTPFIDLVHPETPEEVCRRWESSDKKFKHLQLTDEVRQALADAFAHKIDGLQIAEFSAA